jgi:hypothetical protein
VRSLGLDNLRNADMSPFAARLVDCTLFLPCSPTKARLINLKKRRRAVTFPSGPGQENGRQSAA